MLNRKELIFSILGKKEGTLEARARRSPLSPTEMLKVPVDGAISKIIRIRTSIQVIILGLCIAFIRISLPLLLLFIPFLLRLVVTRLGSFFFFNQIVNPRLISFAIVSVSAPSSSSSSLTSMGSCGSCGVDDREIRCEAGVAKPLKSEFFFKTCRWRWCMEYIMENQKMTRFSFEIDNFWEKVDLIRSPIFLSGGCEWFVGVFPKGRNVEDHYLSVYLCVANPETLRLGWKRRASFSFILLNQSGKELGRNPGKKIYYYLLLCMCSVLTPKTGGRSKELPLKKLKEKGSLENSKLIVKVDIQVHEVVDEGGITGKEMVDYLGFRILYSQLFKKFRRSNQFVRKAYMNLLLGLIKTLNKPPHSFTDTELSNARSEYLTELRQARDSRLSG
ncbi:hypothetical protein Bca101_033192 [Brassica carinata]